MTTILAAAFDIGAFVSIMVLIVLGLGLVASLMGIFNFAHGELVLLGACTVYVVHRAGLPVWLGIVLAPFVVGACGLAIERLVVRRFYTEPIPAMLATYALGLAIRESVRYAIGGTYLSVPAPIGGALTVGELHISAWNVLLIAVTIVICTLCWWFLKRTQYGLLIRAALENPGLASASGISTRVLYAATFTLAASMAGLAGAVIVPVYSLSADLGVRFLIQGFVAIMTGGLGTFAGPLVGAGAVGTASAGLPWFVSPILADVLVFVLAIAFVKARPGGVFASRGR
ncbi:branched-chain amino acid ABC transporter permease [Pararobbsia alpina]|uniref:High-affinity branched-chain amino acid transport system permease protein LivH n=1 Tax=Pararobbsia alpina TaxID=621374 RepID=A0A6S7BDV6_9BURK|nr:branched-chain amino acid ABC transporter permease [Pararobbsia alpina]CAB3797012.1 High-affinity branched-chain amino acid transport system permease protein LivH [Pararobbsia alpina]